MPQPWPWARMRWAKRPVGGGLASFKISGASSILLGGRIGDAPPSLFLIYSAGNFIECKPDMPFFQIGETKYGRPIILRGYDRAMSMEDAVKLLMVSFDSTLKANLSVGLPLDLQVIEKDAFAASHEHRITFDDPYFQAISSSWGAALKSAFHSLPDYSFYNNGPKSDAPATAEASETD